MNAAKSIRLVLLVPVIVKVSSLPTKNRRTLDGDRLLL